MTDQPDQDDVLDQVPVDSAYCQYDDCGIVRPILRTITETVMPATDPPRSIRRVLLVCGHEARIVSRRGV